MQLNTAQVAKFSLKKKTKQNKTKQKTNQSHMGERDDWNTLQLENKFNIEME